MGNDVQLVLIFTVGFALASFLGYSARRLHLPTILGYLIAGYIIGPYFPGYVADLHISEQLAEIGVVLMLFGVGMHFKLRDLINVKNIAIPGAVVQTLVATITATVLVYLTGWGLSAGIIMGLAIGVASTVVLVRMLSDNRLLDTPQGHISIGWLVVEDIFTVAMLILLPLLATFFHGENVSFLTVIGSIGLMLAKFALLVLFMFTWGQRIIDYMLTSVARMRSHELFTLTVLALVFLIATGASWIFGMSMALGAFIAGMVIGKTEARHQAASNALSLKDMFSVIFFLTVGMLFNPLAIFEQFTLFWGILGVILIVKPLAAFLLVLGFGYSLKIALTVAVALAQIGEFSFILAEQAMNYDLLPDKGFDILVGCAMISISLNPILFQLLGLHEEKLSKSVLWKRFREVFSKSVASAKWIDIQQEDTKKIIVVGYGPVGQEVAQNLRKHGFSPTIIEQNIDTVADRKEDAGLRFIFGDAAQQHILETAKIEQASLLVISMPDLAAAKEIIHTARRVNPNVHIAAHVRFSSEQQVLEDLKVFTVCAEKEASKAFATYIHRFIHT